MESVTVQGVEVPALGFGTAPLEGEECYEAVSHALSCGYRHVDTAQMYGNEREVGRALARADVPREDVFVVTKVLKGNLAAAEVERSTRESREKLGVDAIDLLLIHAPSRTVPVAESIEAMNRLQDEGVVDHIGVSNFSIERLEEARRASETPILTNQVEYHPLIDRRELLAHCLEHDVLLTAYSPLAKGRLADHDLLAEIGGRYGKTAPQVALRWLVQQESVAAIPRSADPAHIEANLNVFDFELATEEMVRVFEIEDGLLPRLREFLGL